MSVIDVVVHMGKMRFQRFRGPREKLASFWRESYGERYDYRRRRWRYESGSGTVYNVFEGAAGTPKAWRMVKVEGADTKSPTYTVYQLEGDGAPRSVLEAAGDKLHGFVAGVARALLPGAYK